MIEKGSRVRCCYRSGSWARFAGMDPVRRVRSDLGSNPLFDSTRKP
jgi:hypothetical protein